MSHHSNSIWILLRSTYELQTSDFVALPRENAGGSDKEVLQSQRLAVCIYGDRISVQLLVDDGNRIIIPQGNFKFYWFFFSCFERFFKAVNSKEGKLLAKRRGGYMMDDLELIGLEYLWRVVLYSPEEVAEKAILLLKDIYTNLGPKLQSNQVLYTFSL